MKRAIKIFAVAVLATCLLQACVKKETPSRVVEISYPTITLNGPSAVTLSEGQSWTDPGASWTDSVTHESGTITFKVSTSVDTAIVLYYTATNKNGFQSTVTRGIGVTNMPDTIDISGPYLDNKGNTDTLYKVSRALFFHSNINLYGSQGYIVIKTNGNISVSNILENNVTAPGANLPEYFFNSSISYSRPITIMYTDSINLVPAYNSVFVHQIL